MLRYRQVMPAKEAYLVRTPKGTMVTVQAYSVRGAADAYLADRQYSRELVKGQHFTVQRRGDPSSLLTFVVTK